MAKCYWIWAEGSSDMGEGHPEYVGNPVDDPAIGLTEDRHVSIIPNYPLWRNRPVTPGGLPGPVRLEDRLDPLPEFVGDLPDRTQRLATGLSAGHDQGSCCHGLE